MINKKKIEKAFREGQEAREIESYIMRLPKLIIEGCMIGTGNANSEERKRILEGSMQEFIKYTDRLRKLYKKYGADESKEIRMSSEDFLVMHAQLRSEHSYLWRRK
jgi:hypothetical protein